MVKEKNENEKNVKRGRNTKVNKGQQRMRLKPLSNAFAAKKKVTLRIRATAAKVAHAKIPACRSVAYFYF